MAAIIEGPFRYIVRVPSSMVSTRGMQEILRPAVSGLSLEGEVNGGPGPSPHGTYSYYYDVSFDPGTQQIFGPYDMAPEGPEYALTSGPRQSFVVALNPAEFDPVYGLSRYIGQYVRVNGVLVRPWASNWMASGGLVYVTLVMDASQATASDSVTLELVMSVQPGSSGVILQGYQPAPSIVEVRNGDNPPSDYDRELPIVENGLASLPYSPTWPVGDGTLITRFSRTYEHYTDPRPHFWGRVTYLALPEETVDDGVFWAVGRAHQPTPGSVEFHLVVCNHTGGGNIPWRLGYSASYSRTMDVVASAAQETVFDVMPTRIFLGQGSLPNILELSAEFGPGDIRVISSVDLSQLNGDHYPERSFLVEEVTVSDKPTRAYQYGSYLYCEKACSVRGINWYYP